MRRRSIPGFVMGLISGIVMAIISWYATVILSIPDGFNAAQGHITYYTWLGYAGMLGAILAIIGAAFCFKRARLGGTFMLVGIAFAMVLPIYAFITGPEFSSLMGLVIMPIVLLMIAAICALTAKVREPKLAHTAEVYAAQSQAKFCEHCGSALSNGQCPNCGARQQ